MPKRWIALACACIMLFAGCTNTQKPKNQEEKKTVTLYLPDEQGISVVPTQTEITIGDQSEEVALVNELIEQGVLPQEVAVNHFKQEDNTLTLDFNQAFADALSASGSTGELMIMSSIADTFLAHYGAASLMITVDDKPIETGHAVYDEPFTRITNAAPAQ